MDSSYLLLLVVAGYFLKKARIVERRFADSLIRLVFFIFLPATIFHSLVSVEISPTMFILPVAGFLVASSCYLFGYAVKGSLGMKKPTEGSFLIACGATNQGMFTYPLFLLYLGPIGLSYAAFYDVGQALLSLTLAYYIAMRYGRKDIGFRRMAKKMLSVPVLWAFAFALLINFFKVSAVLEPLSPAISLLSDATIPLVMLSLGIFMDPRIREPRALSAVIFTRFLFGLLCAWILVESFNATGMARSTILIASAVPPAMLTLIYSAEEGLDVEFTSAMLSVCILIGLVYTPLLFALFVP